MQETEEVKRARWVQYFDWTMFETGVGTEFGHKFGRYFSTDGVGVSVQMTRLKVLTVFLTIGFILTSVAGTNSDPSDEIHLWIIVSITMRLI
jgi:hypothetical protein